MVQTFSSAMSPLEGKPFATLPISFYLCVIINHPFIIRSMKNLRNYLNTLLWMSCWCLLLTGAACSDSEDELQDFLTPTAESEALFSSGIQAEAAGTTQNVGFEAGRNWTATLEGENVQEWCSVAPLKGVAGKATVTLTIRKNETQAARTATLTLASGTASRKLNVSQKAQEVQPIVVPDGLSYSPETPDADQPLTITFKADSKSKLYGYTGEVYAHLGVISEGSWLYVPAAWDQNLEKCHMKKEADNVWSLTLSPSVREWFGSGETPVNQLGIVVRSSDGSKKGIEEDSFITVTDTKYKPFQPTDAQMATLPAGVQEGINVVNSSTVTLVLYDKDAQGRRHDYAYVVGDFNDWTLSNDDKSRMYRDEAAGCWWITLSGLDAAKEYAFQYYVGYQGGEALRLADAYTEKILDPDHDKYIPASTYNESLTYPAGGRGIVATFRTQKEEYSWKVNNFRIANPEQLVIYELHLRDFSDTGDLAGALARLDYLKAMGVNAIELMPVQEFDGNDSWGYNPCFFFALDKAYGTRRMYKQFIDACHEAGIAVIFDVVYNHATGSHPFAKLYWDSTANKTAKNNPYFNVDAPHPYSVFHDFNHESELVKQYINRNLQFLLSEYKVDGFRFDLTKGFTQRSCNESNAGQYDASRVAILKGYNAAIRQVNPDAYVILEHFCDSKEESELAADGMHLWRNLNYNYCQSAMGWKDDSAFSGMYEKTPAWVGFMESHDEERAAYKQSQWGNGVLKSDLKARMQQLAANAAFALLVPGPKMIWQFGELGYDISIEENGRTGRKPLHWDYLENADRKGLHDAYTRLMALRNAHPGLFGSAATFTWKVGASDWDNGRSLYAVSVTGEKLVVLGNFTNAAIDVAFPTSTDGTWNDYLQGGTATVAAKVAVPANSYRVFTNF